MIASDEPATIASKSPVKGWIRVKVVRRSQSSSRVAESGALGIVVDPVVLHRVCPFGDQSSCPSPLSGGLALPAPGITP